MSVTPPPDAELARLDAEFEFDGAIAWADGQPEPFWSGKDIAALRSQLREMAAEIAAVEDVFVKEFALHGSPDECPTYYDGCNCAGPDALRALFKQRDAMQAAMQEFVNRVDLGEIRSRYTYAKFKELLAARSASEGNEGKGAEGG